MVKTNKIARHLILIHSGSFPNIFLRFLTLTGQITIKVVLTKFNSINVFFVLNNLMRNLLTFSCLSSCSTNKSARNSRQTAWYVNWHFCQSVSVPYILDVSSTSKRFSKQVSGQTSSAIYLRTSVGWAANDAKWRLIFPAVDSAHKWRNHAH